MLRKVFLCVLLAAFSVSAAMSVPAGETVTVYTTRSNAADKEVMGDFESETGLAVTIVNGKADELVGRILAGGDEPADLFMTVDGGILEAAKARGVFGKTDSPALMDAVPSNLLDRENAWVGVTTRARVIVYSKERVNPDDLSTYAALADPKWKGKVLTRSSGVLYNQSLLASLIAAYGEEKALEWARGVAANLAREPQGNDRDQAKAIHAGLGDLAIMNTYYIGNMLKSDDPEEVAAARSVGVFFPDQDQAGTHINICGVGLVKGAKNSEAALRLVEYLLSVPAQEKLSAGNSEFPVNSAAKKAPLLEGWGGFETQRIDFAKLETLKEKAKAVFDEAGWK